MSADRFDIVIVGGGIMGVAIAYFLTIDPAFAGRVLVVERDPTLARAATARSWGGIRQQFSTPENIAMSLYGTDFLRRAPQLLATADDPVDLGFVEAGYLFLASPDGIATLRDNRATATALGAAIAWLDPAALALRFPWLSVEDIAAGTLGLANEGWFDPTALHGAFRRKARAQGAVFRKAELVAIERVRARIDAVRLDDGARIACGMLVGAAGPWSGTLATLAGCALPVAPRRRSTFVFDCREKIAGAPLTIDPTGVAFRPEGAHFLAIVSPPADADPEGDDAADVDIAPDFDLFEATIWPVLARRVPAFAAIKLVRAWGGFYDYNAFDQNALIGPHPDVANFMLCTGFSGHGIQQAPAAGRAVAELILHGRFATLDLAAFAPARIAANRPLRERNVV
ncbi:MAG: FAD-binding oxidoreductase [Alphaproteobacteria bacterium]|nr:FAD-binding oxidoreductase [Alphaproteobacteria bacterium]